MFRLAATLPDGTAERVLTTTVTAFRPHLRVRDLSARRVVHMIGADQPLGPLEPGQPLRLLATTDGNLVGHVQAKAGAPPATIRATAMEGTAVQYSLGFTSDSRDMMRVPSETPSHLPVRCGSTVVVTAVGTAADSFGLTWLPYGSGFLVPASS
ncbi:hypothetical protein ACFYN3_42765 [Streptomyces lavendulae]|uniref:hypothetical protein n=1 Tax=Streptomyces lavendulae TaxID=1914 RepID=UPI0033C271D0